MELWSLLSITAPGLFPQPEPLRATTTPARSSGGGQAELLARLRRRIRPLVLRRTKEQVAADLPAKQEQVLEVELHPRHRTLYQTHLQRERQKVLGLIDDLNANRFTILRSLTLLRQLSLHAGLVDDDARRPAARPRSTRWSSSSPTSPAAATGRWCSASSPGSCAGSRDRLDAEGVAYCYLDGRTRDRAAVIAAVHASGDRARCS